MIKRRKVELNFDQPWGRVAACLTASAVTLIGIWNALDPEVILLRAVIASLIIGVFVSVVVGLIRLMLSQN